MIITPIDLLEPSLHTRDDLWKIFAAIRDAAPVAWCPGRRGAGYWSVTGHPELMRIARDPATFSSHWGTRPEVSRPPDAVRPLHNLDPPEHGKLRHHAERAVGTDRLDALVERARGWLIARFSVLADEGEVDLQERLVVPLCIELFRDWLGVSAMTATRIWRLVDEVHRRGAELLDTPADADERAQVAGAAHAATLALAGCLKGAIAEAREGGALALLQAAATAGELDAAEALGLAALFVEAGLPTLADAVGGTLDLLLSELAPPAPKEPAEVARLVEELLRLAAPIAQFARRCVVETTVGGCTIEAGQQVVLWFGAANRDPRVFVEPERLDPRRAPNPHLSFGTGPHRCVGAALSRKVLRALVETWRDAPIRLERRDVWPRRPSSYQRGFVTMPARLRRRVVL